MGSSIPIILFIVAAIAFVLALLVLNSRQKSQINIFFSLFMAFVSIWALGVGVFLSAERGDVMGVSAQVYYIAAALIVYYLSLVTIALPDEQAAAHSVRWYRQLLIAVPALLMVATIVIPGILIQSVATGVNNANIVHLNPSGYFLYVSLFVFYAVFVFATLLRKTSRSSGVVRAQNSIITVSIIFGLIFGAVFNLFMPLFGEYRFIWVGPLAIIPLATAIFYSIMRHRLFDVRQTAARTVAYTLSLGVLAATYYLLAYGVSLILFGGETTMSVSMSPVNILLAIMLAFIFQPIKNFFDRLTNHLFYRDAYSSSEFFAELGQIFTTTTDLRTMLQKVADFIAQTIKVEQVSFFIRYGEGSYVSAGTKDRSRVPVDVIGMIDDYFADSTDSFLNRSHLADARLARRLTKFGVMLVFPIKMPDGTVGYMFVGESLVGSIVGRDVSTLLLVPNEMIVAIQNALSLLEVRELNATLQQRIDSATKELRDRNERLRQMDATKDEFISMASHQLRTPLTSIKGYISMVLEGDAGTISRPQRQLLGEAFTSSERMVHLIGDFLNVSRLQNGKFIIDRHASDLAKVVQQEVDSIQQIARSHGMRIVYRIPRTFPTLYIDEGKVRQVVMNFIDNAIYYSPNTTTIKVSLAVEDGDAVLRVVDRGMGVPREVQKKLFTKFFRAGNARTQRPDGTGIGLYLARKVIDGHGGQVVFESTEGQGSTFGFRLPIHALSRGPESEF